MDSADIDGRVAGIEDNGHIRLGIDARGVRVWHAGLNERWHRGDDLENAVRRGPAQCRHLPGVQSHVANLNAVHEALSRIDAGVDEKPRESTPG